MNICDKCNAQVSKLYDKLCFLCHITHNISYNNLSNLEVYYSDLSQIEINKLFVKLVVKNKSDIYKHLKNINFSIREFFNLKLYDKQPTNVVVVPLQISAYSLNLTNVNCFDLDDISFDKSKVTENFILENKKIKKYFKNRKFKKNL